MSSKEYSWSLFVEVFELKKPTSAVTYLHLPNVNNQNKFLLTRRLQAFLIQEGPLVGNLKNDVHFEITLKRFQILELINQVIITAKIKLEHRKQYEPTGDSTSGEWGVDLTEECTNIPLVIVELDESRDNPITKRFRMFPYTDEIFIARLKKCIENGEVRVY